jgi:photosystem II stability/assembly factor-like uncharacterized protein
LLLQKIFGEISIFVMKNFYISVFILLFLSIDGFAQTTSWNAVGQTMTSDLNSVFFVSSDKGWIGGDGGYLSLTVNGGATWAKQPMKITANINEVYFRNNENGYILAGKQVFATTDGTSWSEQKVLSASSFIELEPELYSIRFADKKHGWIVGSVSRDEAVIDSLAVQTEDGGIIWRRATVPTKEELIHLDFVNENSGWIVGANGLILATADGGKTWQKQKSDTISTIYNIDFRNENEGVAVGEKGLILQTSDGGRTWRKIITNFKNTFLRVGFSDDKTIWIAGRGGVILRSTDKGATFLKQDTKVTTNLYGFYIDKKIGFAVGAKGTILKYKK